MRSPSGPTGSIRTASRSPVGSIRAIEQEPLARPGRDLPIGALHPRQAQVGMEAEGDRDRVTSRHYLTVTAIVSLLLLEGSPRGAEVWGNGKASISPRLGGEVEAGLDLASLVAVSSGAETSQPLAAASSPWIGSPPAGRCSEATRQRRGRPPPPRPRSASRPAGWPRGEAAGCPWSSARRCRRRRPPRCPSSSSPRWRSEQQTIPAPGAKLGLQGATRQLQDVHRAPPLGRPSSPFLQRRLVFFSAFVGSRPERLH